MNYPWNPSPEGAVSGDIHREIMLILERVPMAKPNEVGRAIGIAVGNIAAGLAGTDRVHFIEALLGELQQRAPSPFAGSQFDR